MLTGEWNKRSRGRNGDELSRGHGVHQLRGGIPGLEPLKWIFKVYLVLLFVYSGSFVHFVWHVCFYLYCGIGLQTKRLGRLLTTSKWQIVLVLNVFQTLYWLCVPTLVVYKKMYLNYLLTSLIWRFSRVPYSEWLGRGAHVNKTGKNASLLKNNTCFNLILYENSYYETESNVKVPTKIVTFRPLLVVSHP